MSKSDSRRDEGMALIVALIFLVVMGMTATFAATRTINNARHVDHYVDFYNAFEGVEAGLGYAIVELSTPGAGAGAPPESDGLVGVTPGFDFKTGRPTFDSAAVTPLRISTSPQVEFFAYSLDWANDGIDNNGDGQIDIGPESTGGYYSIYSFGRVIYAGSVSAVRSCETIFQSGGTGVWNNAIFAGKGQAGLLINGNVSIHGSVHLLGDDIGPGGLAIDMSGSSGIYNNYFYLSARPDLLSRIPALEQKMFEGELVDTLNATLRVKNGMVSVSGSNTVGQPPDDPLDPPNTNKESLDGVYVNDQWTGNGLDGNGDPTQVYSDNGWDADYDLNAYVPYPTYTDDGGRDHLAYFLETDVNATQGFQEVYVGDMTIDEMESFYWNATTGTEVVAGEPGDGEMPMQADLNPDEFYIWWDSESELMVINGRIAVDGNVAFEPGKSVVLSGNGANQVVDMNQTINYTGKGTILAFDSSGGSGGDVTIKANLITVNADGTTGLSFPGNNLLGIMAQGDLLVGPTSQLDIMGGFYAQGTVTVTKQTNILGTLVGDSFDLGKNVPKIFQVPALMDAWAAEMRMIGADPGQVLFPVSWRETSAL